MINDDRHNFASSSHITSPVFSSPYTYSPMQENVEATICQNLVEMENVVNHEISVEHMYEDTNDETGSAEEEDEESNADVGEAAVRTPILWFTQINENYEVDVYWADSGHQTSFVVGGDSKKAWSLTLRKHC